VPGEGRESGWKDAGNQRVSGVFPVSAVKGMSPKPIQHVYNDAWESIGQLSLERMSRRMGFSYYPTRFRIRNIHAWCMAAVLLMACPLLPAHSQRPKTAPPRKEAPPPRAGRDIEVIDGAWKFATDPSQNGEKNRWEQTPPGTAITTSIPALWTSEAAPNYAGVAWYWREFETPNGWKGQTVRLHFEAVAERAQVWLNGVRLGDHSGGATPFEFNITKTVHIGAANLLAVRVEGEAKAGAGIWQGVLLRAHDEAYLTDIFPQAGGLGNLNIEVKLLNTSSHSGDATLDARIVAANEPKKDIKKTLQNLSLTPNLNMTNMLTAVKGKKLTLWTPEMPFLYLLQFVFRQEKDILDTDQVRFGFREFGFKDGAITLNGLPFTPVAIAPSLPLPVVIATTDDVQRARELLKRLKSGGVNIVYLEAPPPGLLNLADEEGLLVVVSARSHQAADARANELRELILRDRAHPSILAWSLGESDDKILSSLRSLDPTRFLLADPDADPKLWPPNAAESFRPPPGLLPKP
jgi:hypothetical protein